MQSQMGTCRPRCSSPPILASPPPLDLYRVAYSTLYCMRVCLCASANIMTCKFPTTDYYVHTHIHLPLHPSLLRWWGCTHTHAHTHTHSLARTLHSLVRPNRPSALVLPVAKLSAGCLASSRARPNAKPPRICLAKNCHHTHVVITGISLPPIAMTTLCTRSSTFAARHAVAAGLALAWFCPMAAHTALSLAAHTTLPQLAQVTSRLQPCADVTRPRRHHVNPSLG